MEVSLASFVIYTPPGEVLVAQIRPGAGTVQLQECDLSEKARFIQERRKWRAVIDAECRRLEVFLRTCTFD